MAAGGSVEFAVAPTTDEKITIEREVDLSQGANYVENEGFPSEEHETQMDRQTMMAQQLQNSIDSAIRLPTSTDPAFSAQLVGFPSANKAVIVDPTGLFLKFSTQDADAASADNAAASAAAALVSENASAASAAASLVSENNSAASAAAVGAAAGSVKWRTLSSSTLQVDLGSIFVGDDSGQVFTFAANKVFNIAGTPGDLLALNTGSEASLTWYYIIALGDTTGQVAPSLLGITAAAFASFTTADLTGNYAVYDDYHLVAAVRNDTSSNFILENALNGTVYRELSDTHDISINDVAFADQDFSALVPPFAREAQIHFLSNGTNSFQIKTKGTSTQISMWTSIASASDSLDLLLDSSQIIQAQVSASSVDANVVSYVHNQAELGQ